MTLYRSMRGHYRGSQYNALAAPMIKTFRGIGGIWNSEEGEADKFRRGSWLVLEGLALGLSWKVPLPYVGIKRSVEVFGLGKEGKFMEAGLKAVGIHRRVEE